MFGKCWEASRVSLVNVVGSKEYEIFSDSLSSNHIYQESLRLLEHLPNIYQENIGLWDVHVLQCRETT